MSALLVHLRCEAGGREQKVSMKPQWHQKDLLAWQRLAEIGSGELPTPCHRRGFKPKDVLYKIFFQVLLFVTKTKTNTAFIR